MSARFAALVGLWLCGVWFFFWALRDTSQKKSGLEPEARASWNRFYQEEFRSEMALKTLLVIAWECSFGSTIKSLL
jgi:hypothetical protein